MRCTSCDSTIPQDAAFCIECGAPIRAATDRTIQLDTRPAPPMAAPAQLPAAPAPAPLAPARSQSQSCGGWTPFARGLGARSGAIMLIGLGVLFLTGNFWPWILALAGLASAAEELADGKPRAAAQSLIMLGGLAILFATGFFWPWIFILVGLTALLSKL